MRLVRMRWIAAAMVAVGAAAAACGVDVSIEGGPPSATDGGTSDAGSIDPGDGATDSGAQTTKVGDASVKTLAFVDLLFGEPPLRIAAVLDAPSGATFSSVELIAGADVEVAARPLEPTRREFDVKASSTAIPHRLNARFDVAVGADKTSIPVTFKISRYFRTDGQLSLSFPVDTPPTSYEVEVWGAGGGGSGGGAVGGAGGFARGTAKLFGVVTVRVGAPGEDTGAGGSAGGGLGSSGGGGGGGYSALFGSSTIDQPSVLILAGGGGGAGGTTGTGGGGGGGAGGGNNGGGSPGPDGGGVAGGGAAVATPGLALQGGNGGGTGAGGGGAGYFGGGGAGGLSGGAGGSSFARPAVGSHEITASFEPATGTTPGAVANPRRQTAGDPGKAGAVLIRPN